MNKKILIAVAVAIAGIIAAVFLLKLKPEQQKPEENVPQKEKTEVTPESLDESIKSTIEELKPTCVDFLAGDISSEADCPGFDKLINQGLCYYCFAVKNQNAKLCEKINETSGFKMVCQKATGSSIEEIINK
jgi:hypothetical protein